MILKKIKLVNYRNYEFEDIIFNENTNILVGKNAQGKTNLLESIYMCARGSTFKNVKDDQLIKFNETDSYINAEIDNKGRIKKVQFKISGINKKRIKVNEVEIENLSELRSQFGVVLFSPEELKTIKETPSIRRKFIDDIVSNNDIAYKKYLNLYNKVRSQKNDSFKIPKNKYFDEFFNAINKKMIEYGSIISIYRYKYLEILKKYAKEYHFVLSENKEDLDIEYVNNFCDNFDSLNIVKLEYEKKIKENKNREIEQFNSIYGPHKDEFIFKINGLDVKLYGSQGQQRTVVLSLKLAEMKLIEILTKSKPILLLDDVFSELDNQRAKLLVQSIKGHQTIITTNSLINIDTKNMKGNVFKIEAGKVTSSLERNNDGKEK